MLGYIRFRNRYPNSQFEAEALSNIQSLQLSQNDGFTPIGEQYVVVRKSNIFAEPNSKADTCPKPSHNGHHCHTCGGP